jgi:hypothetical protein
MCYLDQVDKHGKGKSVFSRLGIDRTVLAKAGSSFTTGDFKK